MAAYTNSLHNSSLGCWDLHKNLGVFNADISSSYLHMENNAASDMSNNLNFLSNTGYLEDALIEFSVRFKRRRLMISSNDYYDHNQHDYNDPFATRFDDLSCWSNWFSNYKMGLDNQESSHASLLTHDDTVHYSLGGEIMEKPMKEMYEEVLNYEETNTLLLDEAIKSSLISKPSSFNSNSTTFAYNSDTNSTHSSSISVLTRYEREEKRKMKKELNNTTKMVYPFGLVKPGGEEGDITLQDINKRILMPPTRPLKHPVGDFACRPAVSPDGPGLSGKAVVALTRIHTQGRGTITIIRTKG
ncbi:uncharacterized protein LOC130823663 isoform X2 [Amaranthus tricolor]|uniref:uncharacterized protein LOC130823663 isoform X2 n=1 Tax=Amaranthus tricolor TaxID=29722 RepID=UPI002584B4C8|nr:uncharacterized protein LOC130823663 isoform X2 [Amaranthus tricolor]